VSNALGVFSDGVAFDLHEDERDDALRLLDQGGEHPLLPELRALIERPDRARACAVAGQTLCRTG
jgi:hypothetical protein